MSTIVTRSGKGSSLSTAEMDSNLTNLNTDKLENVVEDTTPQLGGSLDVNGNSIVSTSNGNINLTPDGTGLVVAKVLRVNDGTNGVISVDQANGNLRLISGSGTGAVTVSSDTGLDINGDGTFAKIFTGTSNSHLKLTANGTGAIVLGSNVSLDTGVVTTATNTDLTLSPNGTGAVIVNATTSGMVVTDTGSSGFGSITGGTSTGLVFTANAGAQAGTDPSLMITSGGGIAVNAGSSSTATISGSTVSVTGDLTMGSDTTTTLDIFSNWIHRINSITPSGTFTPDASSGNVLYAVPTGNLTINDFASGSIEIGQTITMFIDQSSYSTSYTLTMGSNFKFPGGTAPTLTATGNDLLTMTCLDDGSTSGSNVYIANFVANYS